MQVNPPRAGRTRERGRLELDAVVHRRGELAPANAGQAHGVDRPRSSRVRALLAQRSTVWTIIAVSLALCAPAIATGYILDDYFQTVALSADLATPGTQRAPWDAYTFASSPAQIHQMIEEGVFPWWSNPQARMAFFRPSASLTLWLDHQLWPKSPALMHLQSLCWYGLLLLVVAGVYRRFSASAFSLGFAGLALLLYGIDDVHAMSVGWLANRAALIALLFGFAALLAHDSWRSTGQRRFLFGSLALMALALGGGESGVQAVAYIVAYALFFEAGSKRQRWKSLLPYAGLLIAWRVAYALGGYGAAGSTQYIDPIRNPGEFIQVTLLRLPVLLAAQLGGLSADLGDILRYAAPEWVAWLVPLCLAVVSICLWALYPLWSTRREVRFWTVGMVLSILPVCAVPPADRLLIAPGLGGSALIAILLLAVLDRAREVYSPARKFWAASFAVIHLGIAPLLLPLQSYGLSMMDRYIGDAERSIPDGEDVADKTVVLLNPPTDEFGLYTLLHRRARGGVSPHRLRWIANGDSDLLLTRIDATTLRVRPSRGFFAPGSFGTLRTLDFKSHVGDLVALEGMTIAITDVTEDGRPSEIQIAFDRPIDGSDLVWMRWNNHDGFAPFSLPAAGGSMLVPATDSRSVLVDSTASK